MKGNLLMANANLTNARKAKNDEFYTQWADIEKEVNAYLEFDENVFRDKTILLPADDPFESNFFKYFATHFNDFGLKKLIATSYDPSPIVNTQLELSLFDDNNEQDVGMTRKISRAYRIELTDVSDFDENGRINIDDVEAKLLAEKKHIDKGKKSKILGYLTGDESVGGYSAGDFRSAEVTKLRDEADMIITNPPFSLFREFLSWANPLEKRILVIGNMNAITYKEVFPLIKDNKFWIGATNFNVGMYFYVPEGFQYSKTYKFDREKNGKPANRVPGTGWFTNIDHGRRHQPLSLMTMEDNIKFSKHPQVQGREYDKYDNYDAIEIPYTDSIPSDYDGVMGVPISFLDKYNPDQFEILGGDGFGDTPPTKTYRHKAKVVDGKRMKSQTGTMGAVIRQDVFGKGTFFDVGYPVKAVYKRIFIKKQS